MRTSESGLFTVLAEGTVLATDVPFEVAHEFVHTGCLLCESGEDHTNYSVLTAPASIVASIHNTPLASPPGKAMRPLRNSA